MYSSVERRGSSSSLPAGTVACKKPGRRQQKLNRHLHSLQKLADTYNMAVFVTNQVQANPAILFGDPTRPAGGHIVAHQTTYRVYLRKSSGEKRIAKMIDSPDLPPGECVFKVIGEGVRD